MSAANLGSGIATFRFDYTNEFSCTLSGTLHQNGQFYRIPSATYTCSDGLETTASMTQVK